MTPQCILVFVAFAALFAGECAQTPVGGRLLFLGVVVSHVFVELQRRLEAPFAHIALVLEVSRLLSFTPLLLLDDVLVLLFDVLVQVLLLRICALARFASMLLHQFSF